MSKCIKDCFTDSLDCVLGIRDSLGLNLAEIYLIERRWSGERPGDGRLTDKSVKMSPTPKIMDYSHDIRVTEGGSVKSGDLILKSISKKYSEDDLRTDTGKDKIERFIKVGDHFYRTIHIKNKLSSWDVHIRKVSQDETERKR